MGDRDMMKALVIVTAIILLVAIGLTVSDIRTFDRPPEQPARPVAVPEEPEEAPEDVDEPVDEETAPDNDD